MSTKSRESIYGSSVRHSAERAAEARKEADRLACVAWNQRMLGFKGPADGQMLAACPNCGQSDTLDNASGEAISYLADKTLREMLLAELGNVSDMTITGSPERDYRFIFGD